MKQKSVRLLILFLVSTLTASAFGQSEPLPELLSDSENEQSEVNEWIAELEANPIDINNESIDVLKEIPFLTKTHIDSILHYRPFKYKSQIRSLLGYNIYKHIRPFIILKKTVHYPQIIASHRLCFSLNQKKGFSEKIYLGTAPESLSRIHLKVSQNFSAGFLIQKDPGEIYYYDHFSGFLSWHSQRLPIQLILGNYLIYCGEGLLLSNTYSLPKTAMVRPPRIHKSLSLRTNLSSNEYSGFWGAAVRFGSDMGFKFIAFYSNDFRDAVKSDSSVSILRLDRSGYHRTISELSHQNSVIENSIGIIGHFPFLFFSQIGFSYIKTTYKPGFQKVQPENRKRDFFRFQGSLINNYSLFYASQFGHILLHGEIVPLTFNNLVHKHSLEFHLKDWGFSLRWSYLPLNFQSPFGSSFATSNSFPNALQQFYLGSFGKINDTIRLMGFWYLERELWRSYFQPLPRVRKTTFFQTQYNPFRTIQFTFRYQYSLASENPGEMTSSIQRRAHRYRFQIEKDISTQVRISSRFEKTFISYSDVFPRKSGTNFYQNIYLNHNEILRIKLQFSSFNTLDYDSRIYEYESSLPGVFSNFPLFGSGNKWYVLFTAKPFKGLKIWMKYRQINFDGVDQLGSGLSVIEGNSRQDLHFQIEYRY